MRRPFASQNLLGFRASGDNRYHIPIQWRALPSLLGKEAYCIIKPDGFRRLHEIARLVLEEAIATNAANGVCCRSRGGHK